MKKILLIDCYGIFYRVYHAFSKNPLVNKNGEQTSVIFGFCNTLFSLLTEVKPDYTVCALDSPVKTFRHELYAEYKSNRPPTPDALRSQIEYCITLLDELGLPLVRRDGVEADDIIASYAHAALKEGIAADIFSSDKDLMQLVNKDTRIIKSDFKSGSFLTAGEEEVIEKWGVPPQSILDLLSLVGDSSDNVPGVKGVGLKTAADLISKYGSLENIYENFNKITQKTIKNKLEAGRESAFLSRDLIRLKADVPDIPSIQKMVCRPVRVDGLRAMLEEKQIYSVIKKLRLDEVQGERHLIDLLIRKVPTPSPKENNADNTIKEQTNNLREYSRHETALPDLDNLIKTIRTAGKITFDIETTGLDALTAEIVSAVFVLDDLSSYYVRFFNNSSEHGQEFIQRLKPVLEDPKILKIGHNLKFEYAVLQRFGITLRGIHHDTMLAASLLDASRTHYNLESLVMSQFGIEKKSYSDTFGKNGTVLDAPPEILRDYTFEDGEYTHRLYLSQRDALTKKEHVLLSEQELPLIPVLAQIENNGVCIDEKHMQTLSGRFKNELSGIEQQIYRHAGGEFNINSTKQLQDILFNRLGLTPVRKTKTGFSTDIDVLLRLADSHPVPNLMVRYRTISKLLSTYVEALPLLRHPRTMRIHTSYNQAVTATGRLSSTNPNLQNIPVKMAEGREIRSAFTAPDGFRMVSFDYSQVELRILAQLSSDKTLTAAYARGEDIHCVTAGILFGKNSDTVSDAERRMAKTINFSVIYGISAFSLADDLKVSNHEAKRFIEEYFKAYEGVAAFREKVLSEARETGGVATHYGRRRQLPGLISTNHNERMHAERAAFNTVIQGTASDIIKRAMIRIHNEILTERNTVQMVMQVHDELVFYIPDALLESSNTKVAPKIVKKIISCMTGIEPFDRILSVNYAIGDCWSK